MSSFTIKLIAVITMIIDHIGLFFFPQIATFRIIGRLAFPLFAWLIANGAEHTKDMNKYLKRLFVFALLSQIPYFLANQQNGYVTWDLNVLFTLFLGLLCIKVITSTINFKTKLVLILIFALIAEMSVTNYGAMGVMSVLFFYIFLNNFNLMLISQITIYSAFWYFLMSTYNKFYAGIPIQLIAPVSLIFIYFYNQKSGPKAQHFFYIIYPLQYVLIFIIKITGKINL